MVSSNERLLLSAAKRGAVTICQQVLLAHAAAVDVRENATQMTPLLLAAEQGHADVVTVLLQHGANVHATDPVGMTALHLAAWRGDLAMAQILLHYEADVNVLNAIGQTALHGAALCAQYPLVRFLLDRGANPNIQSFACQRLPLHEVGLRTDKPKERLKCHQLLLKCSPDTLYTIFFCIHNARDLPEWFGRMIRFISDVNDCRIFYTIVRTSLAMQLISTKQAQEFTERAVEQCADYCDNKEDWRTLWLLLQKATIQDKLVRGEFYLMMQEFHERQTLPKRVVSLDLQTSIRKGIRLLKAGVDGDISTLRNCFLFFQQAMTEVSQCNAGDSPITTSLRVDALIGIIGTLLNAILMGRHKHERSFCKILSKSFDLLDPTQLVGERLTRHLPANVVKSVQATLMTGIQAGRKMASSTKKQDQQILDEILSKQDGLVILGLCAGALQGARQDTNNHNKDNTHAADNHSVISDTASTFTNTASVPVPIPEDSFLLPAEEEILKLHKAVKYSDVGLLTEALESAVQDNTINVIDSGGRTALDLAALTGQTVFFEKIRSRGGEPKYFQTEFAIQKMLDVRSRNSEITSKRYLPMISNDRVDELVALRE